MDYSELDGMKKEYLENDRYMPISTQKLALKKKRGGHEDFFGSFELWIKKYERKKLKIFLSLW